MLPCNVAFHPLQGGVVTVVSAGFDECTTSLRLSA